MAARSGVTRTFPPELVDRVVEVTDIREVRRRLPLARLVVYFVLALCCSAAATAATAR